MIDQYHLSVQFLDCLMIILWIFGQLVAVCMSFTRGKFYFLGHQITTCFAFTWNWRALFLRRCFERLEFELLILFYFVCILYYGVSFMPRRFWSKFLVMFWYESQLVALWRLSSLIHLRAILVHLPIGNFAYNYWLTDAEILFFFPFETCSPHMSVDSVFNMHCISTVDLFGWIRKLLQNLLDTTTLLFLLSLFDASQTEMRSHTQTLTLYIHVNKCLWVCFLFVTQHC